ncbi:conserved hypothetical protein [Ricinus communis]|uniref:Uncharacterized protein n=1 Tax=Ricinus communis TaxID=3988 RepID=B9TBD1_RICCO|nr:conserved hypothetical protein [Ricinus communis]
MIIPSQARELASKQSIDNVEVVRFAGLIGSLHLPDLTALPSLKHLSLSGNSFSTGDLSAFTATPCVLEIIDLSPPTISLTLF